ncbi:MAG: DUF4349 domain-containing protein [Planctomycetes bacterium]|nr:DUF4349 domain-containing protein [Planctomycetota bacterium]
MKRLTLMAACLAATIAGGCSEPRMVHQGLRPPPDFGRTVAYAEPAAQAEPAATTALGEIAGTGEPLPPVAQRKLVRDGSLTVAVGDVEAAVGGARDLAGSVGGYVESATLDHVVLRVPSDRFDATFEALGQLGTVVSRTIEARDVTEACTDLELRLKAKQAVLDRYRQLLSRAEKVEDILKIETEIARLTLEIEQLENALQRLETHVAFSRIDARFVAATEAPKRAVRLPFWWLTTVGLDAIMGR